MKEIVPYLIFNGNCREAMTFYKECLDADLDLSPVEGSPAEKDMPEAFRDHIMHAVLQKNNCRIMASDDLTGGTTAQGESVWLSIDCESAEEVEKYYNRISGGGQITMPLQDTFWNARFGMVKDKYGINWMFNYDLPA